jgi:hypothetical protein
MRENMTERHVFFTRSNYALAFVIAGLCGSIGCKQDVPVPVKSSGGMSFRVNDHLWADAAYSGGELLFAVCYDVKYGITGVKQTRLPDGSDQTTVDLVAQDGFTLHLKYVNTKSAIEINGKQYPHAAGRIFNCKWESGKVVVDQFLVAPEAMKGEWSGDDKRITALLESIPELRKFLEKDKAK